ncbi:MAG: hypothetical protein ABIP03_12170 [Aquihabitans sp.]
MKPPPLLTAGAPIRDAAGWVGAACWTELRLHEVITGWLAGEPEPSVQIAFWTVRADRAAQARIWNDRLPQLAEMPRSEFMIPRSPLAVGRLDGLGSLTQADETAARVVGFDTALVDLGRGYALHRLVAVGLADGPVASALFDAVARVEHSRALLASLGHGVGHPTDPLP